MSDTSRLVNVRLTNQQERILNALVRFRLVDEAGTWSASVPNRSEYIRSLIREDYKRAVSQGMTPLT